MSPDLGMREIAAVVFTSSKTAQGIPANRHGEIIEKLGTLGELIDNRFGASYNRIHFKNLLRKRNGHREVWRFENPTIAILQTLREVEDTARNTEYLQNWVRDMVRMRVGKLGTRRQLVEYVDGLQQYSTKGEEGKEVNLDLLVALGYAEFGHASPGSEDDFSGLR